VRNLAPQAVTCEATCATLDSESHILEVGLGLLGALRRIELPRLVLLYNLVGGGTKRRDDVVLDHGERATLLESQLGVVGRRLLVGALWSQQLAGERLVSLLLQHHGVRTCAATKAIHSSRRFKRSANDGSRIDSVGELSLAAARSDSLKFSSFSVIEAEKAANRC